MQINQPCNLELDFWRSYEQNDKNKHLGSKQIRGYDNRIGLLEEMADAYICLEFLKSIFDITPEELQKAMDVKLQRERNKQR